MTTVRARAIVLLTAIVLALVASCAKAPTDPPPKPPLNLPEASDTVTALIAALSKLDVSDAPLDSSRVGAQAEVTEITADLAGFKPTVTAGPVAYAKDQPEATVPLTYTWAFPSGPWTYETTVKLVHQQGWKAMWAPTVIHPKLTSAGRLDHTRSPAKRAGIVGNNGVAIVEEHTVIRVGIDKTLIPAAQWDAAARALAAAVGVNVDAYAKQVAASGPRAFVLAITLRQGAVPAAVAAIDGAVGLEAKAMLPLTKDFAHDVIGVVGDATAEIMKASNGAVLVGDQVGLTGLQKRFDEQLRGKAGDRVTIVARKAPAAAPSGSVSPKPSPQPSLTPLVVFNLDPVAGTPLQVSLDVDLQLKAQNVMGTVTGPAAAAIIRPSDGAVLAMANSPGSAGQPDANAGRYAPGSTMKVATTLALLRKGYTPDTLVNCTAGTTVNGWPFKNYSDFPTSRVGRIPLKDAVAASCNTAFINEWATITADDLVGAAASLGLGIDYPTGANIFFGEVPKADSNVKKAQEFIGQGGVLASPVVMASVAASVSAGKTVLPWVAAPTKPTSKAAPLTAAEAEGLRTVMTHTVQTGSGRALQGVAIGAKTGTAEYGTGTTLPTHAWMIAYTANDLAVAVWVKDGTSGSGTAGPIIRSLLT